MEFRLRRAPWRALPHALLVGAVFFACPAPAAQVGRCPAVDGVPSDSELEARGARVREIRYDTRDIFDPDVPGENRKLFLLANRLHVKTRSRVIEHQLLVRPGDRYSRRLLDESERVLRKDTYLYEARICPVAYAGNQVDVEVLTRDVWTLRLGLGVGRTGGRNTNRIQVADDNLLGTGKSLTLERLSLVDRTSLLARYVDPNVLGSRVRAGGSYAKNSDGRRGEVFVERPFFALDTRWAAGLDVYDDEREDTLYTLGHVTNRFLHRERFLEAYGGISDGLVGDRAVRWSVGYTYDRDLFGPAIHHPFRFQPPDRTISYPWLGVEIADDRFLKASDLDQIHRVEDLEMGTHVQARLGWAGPTFGATVHALMVSASATRGWQFSPRQTLLLATDLAGRIENRTTRNALWNASARYYLRDFSQHLLFASVELSAAHELDAENQLLLGGDSGLRGYPLRFQAGDRRILLSVEQRFYTDWYPWRLLRIGAAVFADAGHAWVAALPNRPQDLGWLRDVGFGLRLSPSRTGLGNVVHVDVAFPLDRTLGISSVQWLVKTHASF